MKTKFNIRTLDGKIIFTTDNPEVFSQRNALILELVKYENGKLVEEVKYLRQTPNKQRLVLN